MAITTQLVGKLGGALEWKTLEVRETTFTRPTALKITVTRATSVYLTLSGNLVSKIVRGTQVLALNAGDSVSSLPYQSTEYAYLD